MNRHGFALLTALWLVAALALVVAAALVEVGPNVTRNRIVLTRAAWARQACVEILTARFAANHQVRRVDTVDLGRNAWCRAELEESDAKLDVNRASPEALRVVLPNDTLVDALLDWRDEDDVARPQGAEAEWYRVRARRVPRNRPLASVAELAYVRGFDGVRAAALERVLTARGTGKLDLNAAPLELLPAVPGMTAEAVRVLRDLRLVGRRVAGVEELIERLSPPARQALLDRYADFVREAGFEPTQFTMVVEGGVKGTGLTSRGWITFAPAGAQLVATRREME